MKGPDRPGRRPPIPAASTRKDDDEDDGPFAPDPPVVWPPVPGTSAQIPPFLGQPPPGHPPSRPPPVSHPPPRGQPGRPPPGLLDLVISWRALNGDPAGPATLSRIGPITGLQALLLALTAAADPHARWQVILTDPDGYAIATETVRRRHRQGRVGRPGRGHRPGHRHHPRRRPGPARPRRPGDPGRRSGATGPSGPHPLPAARPAPALRHHCAQLPAHWLRDPGRSAARRPPRPSQGPAPGRRGRRRARRVRPHQPPPRPTGPPPRSATMSPPGTRPAATPAAASLPATPTSTTPSLAQRRADMRVQPRRPLPPHHKIKQLPGWTLTQPRPGHFQLTTPAGRTYTATPDPYPAYDRQPA